VAVDNFVWRGESIAREFPEAAADIMAAGADIRHSGAALSVAARGFTADPCSLAQRGMLVSTARDLLAAVARLLILADMIDVHVLVQSVTAARTDLEFVGRRVSSEPELIEGMRRFTASSGRLVQLAGRRQADLKDRQAAAGLAAARAVLKKTTPLLYTSCNVHVRYPQSSPAANNRETVTREICRAVDTIWDIAEGRGGGGGDQGHMEQGQKVCRGARKYISVCKRVSTGKNGLVARKWPTGLPDAATT